MRERKHAGYGKFQGYLKENRIRLDDVAKILNTTVSMISLKNNGWSDYTGQEMNAIAKYFKVPMDQVFRI